jgi:hypothetical protein
LSDFPVRILSRDVTGTIRRAPKRSSDGDAWTHPLVLESADTELDLIIGKHRDLLDIMIMRGYGPQARQYEDRNRNQLIFTPSPISQPQRREATHLPKPSTRPERITAKTTRYTPTCGPNRGSLRMTSWRGGSCSRLPVFRFNVGIRGLCLCLRRHLSICRFVEFAIVGIWIGEKGEREMKSISYPKRSESRYTSPHNRTSEEDRIDAGEHERANRTRNGDYALTIIEPSRIPPRTLDAQRMFKLVFPPQIQCSLYFVRQLQLQASCPVVILICGGRPGEGTRKPDL